MKKFSVKTIVAIGIGAALFFVCGRFISIPSPVPNTSITIQYGVQAFIATVYGPVAGLLSGFIGHALIDLSWGAPWWSWIIATAVFGLFMGIACKRIRLYDGVFSAKEAVRFNVSQLIIHALCWGVIAPALDILIYSEPVEKIFAQGLVAGIANAVTTAIVGSLLCLAYAKTKAQKGSLSKEK